MNARGRQFDYLYKPITHPVIRSFIHQASNRPAESLTGLLIY